MADWYEALQDAVREGGRSLGSALSSAADWVGGITAPLDPLSDWEGRMFWESDSGPNLISAINPLNDVSGTPFWYDDAGPTLPGLFTGHGSLPDASQAPMGPVYGPPEPPRDHSEAASRHRSPVQEQVRPVQPIEAQDPFLRALTEAQANAADLVAEVDSWYDAELAELREQYALAETAQERANLQFMLDDLEARRDAAYQGIETSYADAIAETGERAAAMEERASEVGQRVGNVYSAGAEDLTNLLGELGSSYADAGLGLGSGTAGYGRGTGSVRELAEAAPREQAYAEQMFGLGAQDVAALAAMMEAEGQAQAADLERLAMGQASQIQAQHGRDVSQRIAQDRRAMAAQQQALSSDARRRQQQLEDMLLELEMAEGEYLREQQAGEAQRAQEQDRMGQLAAGLGLSPEELAAVMGGA